MKYQYNFGFLDQWIQANSNIPKGVLLKAFGVKSNNGIKAWAQKDCPMPIIGILRFCNTFQVPISAFIKDSDAEFVDIRMPHAPGAFDDLEPKGGYARDASERTKGERTYLNPLDVDIVPSFIPGMINVGVTPKKPLPPEARFGQGISEDSIKAIIDLENKQEARIVRLLDIIASQQSLIAELTHKVIAAKKSANAVGESSEGYGTETNMGDVLEDIQSVRDVIDANKRQE